MALAAGVTDETFAVASFSTIPEVRTPAGMAGLVFGAWASWFLGTVLGGWIAPFLPKILTDAMGVTLYGLFIGLLVPAIRSVPRGAVIAAAAMLIHLAARQVLPPGWAIVAAILGGSLVGVVMPWGQKA